MANSAHDQLGRFAPKEGGTVRNLTAAAAAERHAAIATRISELPETALAYMAGLVDGEGCITATVSKSGTVTFGLVVANTDQRMIDWINTNFVDAGANWRKDFDPTGNQKDLYVWRARKATAILILRAIYPFMVIKRDQVNIFIALAEATGSQVRGNELSVPEKRERVAELHALNRRGRTT